MDPVTGVLTGECFTLKYHDVPDICDILVLRQNYDMALQRNWQPGDRFRAIVGNSWWEGYLEAREPLSAECPNSLFLGFLIRYFFFPFLSKNVNNYYFLISLLDGTTDQSLTV